MKYLLVIVLLVFIVTFTFSQEEKEFNYSFQTSPLMYLIYLISLGIDHQPGTYQIPFEFEFQYAINNYLNISINPIFNYGKYGGYVGFSGGNYGSTDTMYNVKNINFSIIPGLLYRPLGTRLKGFYIGLFVPLGYEQLKSESYIRDFGYGWTESGEAINDKFFEIGVGISSGYQWIFRNGFTISLGLGGQKTWSIASKNNTGSYTGGPEYLFKLPFQITLPIRIGYSF